VPVVEDAAALLPHLTQLRIDRISLKSGRVRIEASTTGGSGDCPGCCVASARVHSRYVRRLADSAIGGAGGVVSPGGDRYQTSLWEVDPAGAVDARRLTHSEQAESEPAFAGDGSLLFTSKRPGPGDSSPDGPALWRLPQRGEAVRIATSAAGPVGAAASPAYVVATSRLAGATEETDQQWRSDRRHAKVTAIIHDGFPIRLWDHELGPDFPRLLVGRTGDDAPPRDIAPDAGPALVEAKVRSHAGRDGGGCHLVCP
jgi:hypothetical protein